MLIETTANHIGMVLAGLDAKEQAIVLNTMGNQMFFMCRTSSRLEQQTCFIASESVGGCF